jgi:hypothetical protein
MLFVRFIVFHERGIFLLFARFSNLLDIRHGGFCDGKMISVSSARAGKKDSPDKGNHDHFITDGGKENREKQQN